MYSYNLNNRHTNNTLTIKLIISLFKYYVVNVLCNTVIQRQVSIVISLNNCSCLYQVVLEID